MILLSEHVRQMTVIVSNSLIDTIYIYIWWYNKESLT